MQTPTAPVLAFGPFTLDLAAARLTRDGTAVALRPKAYELLAALARRPGELVTKDELLDTVWGRRFITEGVIKSVVGELRAALGEDPKQPLYIETVPRRGYRFALPAAPPPAARPAPVPAVTGAVPGNLPAVVLPAIGRDADLAALREWLAQRRLLTIVGPSGIGKTRLAQALAQDQRAAWPDGVWFVELAPLAAESTGKATLCAALAQALRLGEGAAADAAALARALQPLALLLVVDNAEHLLTPLAPLLAAVLSQAPLLRIVVTSQEPLRIASEQVFQLAPLALPPPADDSDATRLMHSSAVQLFVERVAARLPGFRLAPEQQGAVAAICRALDGLPLALELAAARVPVLGVHGIEALLLGGDARGPLQLLTQGERTAAPRQRTLRAALQWSHELLDDTQRRVFRRLGVFQGGFSLDDAQAVCADAQLDAWGVLDAVNALHEKSLVSALSAPGAGPRFTLLAGPRAYALERLAEAGEDAATRGHHLRAVQAFWERADARSLSDPALPWLARQLQEIDNLRAALRWALADAARADAALRLVAHTTMLWHRAGLVGEGRTACDAVRARAQETPEGALRRGFDLAVAALGVYGNAYPPAEALAAARRAADALEAAGDGVRAYFACYLTYQLVLRAAPQEDRAALVARMQALAQPGWSELLLRYLRTAVGYELRLGGQTDLYIAHCSDELRRCRQIGALAEAWVAAQGLMLAQHDAGRIDDALATAAQALDEIRAEGRLRQNATLLALWATLLAECGTADAAGRALAETVAVLRSTGTPWMAHVALAWRAARDGRPDDAARVLGWHDAAQVAQRRGSPGVLVTGSLQRLRAQLLQSLGPAAFDEAASAGRTLGDAAAAALALDTAG